MQFHRRHVLGALVSGVASLASPKVFAAPLSQAAPEGLAQAKAALDTHAMRVRQRDLIGLVDFGAPSASARFQLVDLGNARVLSDLLVAHGRGSDPGNTGMVHSFSNRPGSNASSQGSFLVGETYFGQHGHSRRLHGLDPDNSLAYQRAIVIHGAPYVSPDMARHTGRIGRSLGCFAVSLGDIRPLLAQLGPGTLLFAHK
ncbi:murein L,D-transpeptidase catalytic domain family protein [Novosphingobium sp. 1949]|uniref:Murein L,D-transpeptidase catalytic domain family protein n=1 Tax=Novosphingobium organovorum TaxID=2930092 RepID=A0ABT0B9H0_9SPHN|nr:murein L,D-transpeptidase catalytic domain family protein [Novosphingobium organovorum]MCJ2181722.1 murein L,D-transpeptidase catalytic domain family protein [Novosphingobium organovorum]